MLAINVKSSQHEQDIYQVKMINETRKKYSRTKEIEKHTNIAFHNNYLEGKK